MLAALQRELKGYVAKDKLGELFDRLTKLLRVESKLYNLTIGLQQSYSAARFEHVAGSLSFEEGNLQFSSIRNGLLYVIDEIRGVDLRPRPNQREQEFVDVPTFHAYGVNREEQASKFEEDQYFGDDPDCKVHFYYLYGDLRQEAPSLVKRLGLELTGRTLDATSLEVDYGGREPLFVECKPPPRPKARLFQLLLLKGMIEKFIGPINNMRKLGEMTLLDLLASPKLKSRTAEDAVCILVRVDHHNWNKDIIPPVLRELYEKFCQASLPATSPKFYFFFGIEYPKTKVQLRREVEAAIQQRRYGEALKELHPVTSAEIAEWFTRHEPLIPAGHTPESLVQTQFTGPGPFDMEDVERWLLGLIRRNKEQLLEN